jgi:2-oxo-4-hydroxy-4-carboxy-5-ureidoimidazoline decarboxylase
MDTHDFIGRYGSIYEHSPWVAEQVSTLGGDIEDSSVLATLMADCVDNAAVEQQLELIRAHPDLAGKAQVAGELTQASTVEQASAGLDQCSPEEFTRFQELNDAYWEKFGFPFVMAVRGQDRVAILEAFAQRLGNDHDLEFETALIEIHKIARLRLDAMRNNP